MSKLGVLLECLPANLTVTYAQQAEAAGFGRITTEVTDAPTFYYAESYHQQYLAKNPGGYCGLAGTGVGCALPGSR